MTLIEELIELIRAKPISDQDRHRAALFVLDAVACAAGARKAVPARILRAWSQRSSGDAGRNAFLLAGLVSVLEMDDVHRASSSHPGCVIVPAALALALREDEFGLAIITDRARLDQ